MKSKDQVKGVIVIVVLFALVAGGYLLFNQRVHGDWRCAFARCVKVTP